MPPVAGRQTSNWIKDFVQKVGPKSEAPEKFLYWAAVVTTSGALRRRCYLDFGNYRWYPNWYVVLVGQPGLVKKSTTIDVATKLLREVPGVVFGPDCATWQAFVQTIAGANDTFSRGGGTGNFIDQTYEQTCAVTFAISEFGTFFDPNDPAMINMMTEFWDGKDVPFVKATKTQGSDVIKAPFVNLIAGTTPQWVSANFSRRFGGWGLSSRIIFLHASDVEQLIPYGDEVWGDELHTWGLPFKDDLITISQMEGRFQLVPDARDYGKSYYQELMSRIRVFGLTPNTDPWIGYYLQRKFAHIHKLAMVLSAAEEPSYWITLPHLREAIDRCEEVETEISRVFQSQHDIDNRVELTKKLGQHIVVGLLKSGPCPASRIYRYTYQFTDSRQTDNLISHMVKAGYLDKVQDGTDLLIKALPLARELLSRDQQTEVAAALGELSKDPLDLLNNDPAY